MKPLVVIVGIAILLSLVTWWYTEAKKEGLQQPEAPKVAYSLQEIEIANTKEERAQGLSGRTDVPEEYGLLFIFDTPGSYGFWMKDMHVSIDIIWVSDTGSIVGINESVSPDTYPEAFYPPGPVRYVLETRAGEAARKGWNIGTVLTLPL